MIRKCPSGCHPASYRPGFLEVLAVHLVAATFWVWVPAIMLVVWLQGPPPPTDLSNH